MPGGRRPTSRRSLPLWSIVGLAIVAGLAIGRFVAFDGGGAPTAGSTLAATAPTSASSVERVAALEAAVAADPDDGQSWAQLGGLYTRRAVESGDPSFYELSARAFERAGDLVPGDPALLVGRGVLALSLHRFEEAEALGREAVAELPGSAEALSILVDAQVELGRYDDAAETLQEMLDRRPGLPALARTSYLRELHGDLAGAQDAMRRAIVAGTSSPFDEATVTALLGDLLLADGDLQGALERYDEALVASPGHLEASLGQVRALAAQGRIDDATAAVRDVADRFPSPGALSLLAELQHVAGDTAGEADTIELVRLTTVLQEEAGQVVDLELAIFEADIASDPERAVELARQSYDARPQNVFAADALAWALLRAGDAAAALPLAEQAIRLGTADPLLHYHAAEVFAAVGDDARAATHLQQALRGGTAFAVRHAAAAEALARDLGVAVPVIR